MDTINNTVVADFGGWFTATPTTALRWVKRLYDPNNFNSETIKILQQQWKIEHSKNGVSYEWKDIPVEE